MNIASIFGHRQGFRRQNVNLNGGILLQVLQKIHEVGLPTALARGKRVDHDFYRVAPAEIHNFASWERAALPAPVDLERNRDTPKRPTRVGALGVHRKGEFASDQAEIPDPVGSRRSFANPSISVEPSREAVRATNRQ